MFDWLTDWLDDRMTSLREQVDIASWVDSAEEWIEDTFSPVFEAVTDVATWMVETLQDILLLPYPLITAILFGLLAWYLRSAAFGVVSFVAFFLLDVMELWQQSMETLSQVLVASLAAVAIGVPIGIAASRSEKLSSTVRPILDFMQTMPPFVYLIPAAAFFGLGVVPGAMATVVFAMPPAVRLTELGIRQVDHEVVEAGEAFGTPSRRILTRIQIPLAMPTIMAGVNQVIMLSLSMVVIASLVGAPGLGAVVFRAISRLDTGRGFEGGLGVVILAIFLDRVTAGIGQRSTSRVGERETA